MHYHIYTHYISQPHLCLVPYRNILYWTIIVIQKWHTMCQGNDLCLVSFVRAIVLSGNYLCSHNLIWIGNRTSFVQIAYGISYLSSHMIQVEFLLQYCYEQCNGSAGWHDWLYGNVSVWYMGSVHSFYNTGCCDYLCISQIANFAKNHFFAQIAYSVGYLGKTDCFCSLQENILFLCRRANYVRKIGYFCISQITDFAK